MLAARIIDTTRGLRTFADAWDDLWRRSGVELPTKRAEMIAQWIEHFVPRCRFLSLVVEDQDQLVAALPFFGARLGRILPVGRLPINSFSSAGDLLVDGTCDQQSVLECLAAAIRRLPWPALWLDTIELRESRWVAFQKACRESGLPTASRRQFDLGLVSVADEWQQYRRQWSKNHRKDMDRRLRKAERLGDLRLEVYDALEIERVEEKLRVGFEVENRSWKGPAGTSALQSGGEFEFYLRQARQLAKWGQLRISLLCLNNWPIAFEYGYRARGVYFSHKVGYDSAYRALAPGQLLMMMLLERDHCDREMRLTNCMGVLTGAVAKWCTHTRSIGRLVVGTGGWLGRATVENYRRTWPAIRGIRRIVPFGGAKLESFSPGCSQHSTDVYETCALPEAVAGGRTKS